MRMGIYFFYLDCHIPVLIVPCMEGDERINERSGRKRGRGRVRGREREGGREREREGEGRRDRKL